MHGFLRKAITGCLALCATAGLCWGQEKASGDEVKALRELIQKQQQQIDALNKRVTESGPTNPVSSAMPSESGGGDGAPAAPLDTAKVKTIIADYLRDNPGTGMPSGVQTGYSMGTGFYVKSTPNPAYSNWNDESRIPFEMRFRGRVQTNYDFYKVQDNYNHLTKQFYNNPNTVPLPVANAMNTVGPYTVGDESVFEVKRLRLIWEGNLFTPDLTYEFQLDANTRGFQSFQNNRVFTNAIPPATGAFAAPGVGGLNAIGGPVQTDNAARVFTAWVAYQVPLGIRCGNVPDGMYSYTPSLTFIAGKQQPYFSLIEILGSANSQFSEFHMADWFFDTDANNMMTGVSAQLKAFDDRLMMMAQVVEGSDFGISAQINQRTPEFIGCAWYDFGGEFDQQKKRWNLFGNSISDLNYSRCPTLRLGGAVTLVRLDPRNQYGDIPSSFFFAAPGAPGGTRLINLFNGGGAGTQALQSLNRADINTFDLFAAFHYRGFSFYNEWYFRNYDGLHSVNPRSDAILYNDGFGAASLLNRRSFMDYGMAVQSGYFVIPKKFELIGLYSMINGVSGDIYGNGTFRNVLVPTNAAGFTTVRSYNGAFSNPHMAQEIGGGFNYYWFGQLVKWQNDLSYYRGGNPAGNGAAPAGFLPGVDGWMIRSQIQLAF
jgi:hypothetical protein